MGRFFEPRDIPTVRLTADVPTPIINQGLAMQLWGDEDPIGRRILTPRSDFTVVGVVGDVRQYGPRSAAPAAQVYLPLWYANFFKMGTHYLIVRTTGEPGAVATQIRTVASSIDAERRIHPVRPMKEVARQRMVWDRLGFGGVAAVLAALGLYALLSHSVSRRAREIGIRVALGGSPAETRGADGQVLKRWR